MEMIKNRLIRSWKSTLIGVLLLIATFYLIYLGTITYEAAAPLIVSLWQFFRTDKSVKKEMEKKREQARKMSDTALRDAVDKLADK